MKLWDRECMQTFEFKDQFITEIYHATFNPNDTFATVSFYNEKYTLKVWSLDLGYNYPLHGHSSKVNCLDFFTCHDQEFLVTGSDDWTAKIWYLPQKICVYTLEAFVSPVKSVLYQPNLQNLIIGSNDGAIYLWRTKICRICSCPPTLTRIIKIGCVGGAYHLACVMRSIVIGEGNTVAFMDINNVHYHEQLTDYNKWQLSADTRQHVGDTTSKLNSLNLFGGDIAGCINPRELRFPYNPNDPISCSLYLTNNTNENVAFRLVDKSRKSPWCFTKLPLYGIVPPRSTYTLIVTTKEEMRLKENKDFDLVIQSSLLGGKYIMVFQNQSESDHFFEEAKEFGNMVHEVILEAVYQQYKEIKSEVQNISVKYNPDDMRSIDAHPTQPWVLTGHRNGYACVWNHEMKVWRLDSNTPEYSLPGHYDMVNCLDFIRRGDQHYLVSGHQDCTAKIWDLQKRECICTLQAMSPVLCALAHPTLPVLITGTQHGIIQIWSSADFRLKRTINLGGGGGPVVGLACLMGSQRIVIGQENAISIMDYFRSRGRRRARALAKQAETELTQAEEEDGETEVLTRAKAEEAGAKQRWAEHSETEEQAATQEQRSLQPGSAAEAECSQAKGEHREREEPAVLPPKSGYAMSRVEHRRREKRRASRARAPARRAEAEGSTTEAEPVFWLSVCEFSRDGRNSAILKIS
ncbi:hypothetical protein CFC21_106237 [Triticum aestivum]|uniref:MSP domain-containing protein n=2 Tax=Triticum aestivum TaxID=4565 RepID=A0A3B6SVV1_WHEAT|nr:hypothetical protein CFC21_106237 [Triticum aestivum]